MARLPLLLLVASALLAAAGCEDPVPARSASDLRYASLEGQISFTNPWFDTPKGQTAHIGIRIDGQGIGRCDKDVRDTRTVCVDGHTLSPGWHIINIDFSYAGGSMQDYVHFEDRLLVGANEQIVFDLSKSGGGEQSKYVTRSTPKRELWPCEKEIHTLAGAPSCTTQELTALMSKLTSLETTCSSISPDDEAHAQGALSFVFDNLFALTADHCLTVKEMKHIPRIFTATAGDVRWWPPGTLKVGSWGWAHSVYSPGAADAGRSVKQRIGTAKAALPQLLERLTVVEEMTTSYASDKKPQAAIDKALAGPFDLDPRTTNGHRMHLLLHGPDFARATDAATPYYDERLAEHVARGLAASTVHCGQQAEASLALGYLYADKKLRKAEWAAIQSAIQRTPADVALVDACAKAVTVPGEVSQVDRLRWLASWDCSKERTARGEAIRPYLSSSSTVPADLRKRVHAEFAECIGHDS